jgi:hypothetical protein
VSHVDDEDDDLGDIQRQRGDRRHLSITQVAVVLGMLAQLAALVWGAATLSASVNSLRETMIIVTTQINAIQTTVNAQSVELGILKDRVYKK